MAAHGVRSIQRYFAELRTFTMLAHASEIRCPTLIIMETTLRFSIEADQSYLPIRIRCVADACTLL
jgi:hypothetical protein